MVQFSAEAKAEGKGVAVKYNKFTGLPMLKMKDRILEKTVMDDSLKGKTSDYKPLFI